MAKKIKNRTFRIHEDKQKRRYINVYGQKIFLENETDIPDRKFINIVVNRISTNKQKKEIRRRRRRQNKDIKKVYEVISSGYSNDDLKDIKERVKKEDAKNELQK